MSGRCNPICPTNDCHPGEFCYRKKNCGVLNAADITVRATPNIKIPLKLLKPYYFSINMTNPSSALFKTQAIPSLCFYVRMDV